MVVEATERKAKMTPERLTGIETVKHPNSEIEGVVFLPRMINYDERGGLIVTFGGEGDPSVYSYWSVTRAGFARDVDRFHVHQKQKDRFTVVGGKMWILLLDMREGSKSFGKLEVAEMTGFNPEITGKTQVPVYTLVIPEGVYHCIKAPGPERAELINHPTRPYDPQDEGRVPFDQVEIPGIGYFNWGLVYDTGNT